VPRIAWKISLNLKAMDCRKEVYAYPFVENLQSPQQKDDPDGENDEADDNDGSVRLHDSGCFDSWFVLEMRWGIENFFRVDEASIKDKFKSVVLLQLCGECDKGLVDLHVTEGLKANT
jgi:hypothetical protein